MPSRIIEINRKPTNLLFFTMLYGDRLDIGDVRGSPVVKISAGSRPARIVTDDTSVFWTARGTPEGNGFVPATGTVGRATTALTDPKTIASAQNGPFGIGVDRRGFVYWANELDGTIMRMPSSGSGTPKILASEGAGSRPAGLYASEERVYWTNRGTGQIRALSLEDGSTPETLASGQSSPFCIDVSRDGPNRYVFWINSGSVTSADGSLMVLSR
jgi:hypothetical protein